MGFSHDIPPRTLLMHPGTGLDTSPEQQGNHHEGAIVAIGHHHIGGLEGRQEFSQQRCLAGLLSRVRPECQIGHTGRRQRENRHGAYDRKTNTFLLMPWRRVLGLILRRIGHGECETINQLRMMAFPQSCGIGLLLHVFGDPTGQLVQGGLRQFAAGTTVVTGVGTRRQFALLNVPCRNARDGRLAGRFLAVT